MGHRFRRRFGRILGGFWEAENLDFRIFFDDFSKQISKHVLEGQKMRKNREKTADSNFLGRGAGGRRLPGEKYKEGYEDLCDNNLAYPFDAGQEIEVFDHAC